MDLIPLVMGALLVGIVIALAWAIRQGPPDDGIGPAPPSGTYWG